MQREHLCCWPSYPARAVAIRLHGFWEASTGAYAIYSASVGGCSHQSNHCMQPAVINCVKAMLLLLPPAQSMLKQWICATTGRVVFTPKGRAYNIASPNLGTTANAALLSVIYAQIRSPYVPAPKAERYTCFARAQVRAACLAACRQAG